MQVPLKNREFENLPMIKLSWVNLNPNKYILKSKNLILLSHKKYSYECFRFLKKQNFLNVTMYYFRNIYF